MVGSWRNLESADGPTILVLTGQDNSSTGLGNDRPNVSGNPNSGPHNVNRWFNTNVFTPNLPLTFGNAGRNIVVGPGFHNFDFSVVKNTKIGETVNLQFRSEFFNIFNHPNFALPHILAAPNFGTLFQPRMQPRTTLGSVRADPGSFNSP